MFAQGRLRNAELFGNASRAYAVPDQIAVQLRAFGGFALGETVTFVILLMVAFVYVWRRGALEWK